MNNMNNPRMGMMGPNMNRMPMGYQDQMSGGMGYPIRAMGGGMGAGPNMGNMGPGRMMGPGPGMMRGPGPSQYPGGQAQAPRIMNPGPGGAAQPSRMPPTTPMDTSPGPGPPVSSGGQMSGAASGPVTGGDTGAVTMTDGGGQQTETQAAAPPPVGQTAATPNTAGAQNTGKVTPSPQKEVNISTVCRIGQETVEEIVSRTQEVFSILKSLHPPVGAYSKMSQIQDQQNLEKQKRLKDVLNGIGLLFKRLAVCWEKCQENTGGMDFYPIQSLIPLKDENQDSGRTELEKKRGDGYKSALEEHNELVQQITVKNRHLKDIIDQMRNIIWEINTMLAMRTN